MKINNLIFGEGHYAQELHTGFLNIMKLLQEQLKQFKNSLLFLNLVLINQRLKQILKTKIFK